ncbi:hypothetical protein NU08_3012 [Flavobacterium anhuiense]|uniref:Uncharacterized protein n=1 Tax=Flavobacterium anhuiense TaxID=459526 RepID=A0A444VX10_9FLAO|nr:hypothetical protein [Flavobacterium anhuiense]RYJ38109.1 hypothetical protein NU08_3012 [Flavobacterium anhuiense]
MKKVFLGMLLIALGFGTMSLTTSSDNVTKVSVEASNVVFGPTYTAPWLGICCESPLTAAERDIVKRGYPATTQYTINSTTSNTVTYTIY